MTSTTENRIWRGLFLAAIVGCGIAATSGGRADKVVGGFSNGFNGRNYLVMQSGNLVEFRESANPIMGNPLKDGFRKVDMTGLNQ